MAHLGQDSWHRGKKSAIQKAKKSKQGYYKNRKRRVSPKRGKRFNPALYEIEGVTSGLKTPLLRAPVSKEVLHQIRGLQGSSGGRAT